MYSTESTHNIDSSSVTSSFSNFFTITWRLILSDRSHFFKYEWFSFCEEQRISKRYCFVKHAE